MSRDERRYLPIMLDVSSRRILLIGGGAACAEKLRSLSQLQKRVTAIAPHFCEAMQTAEWVEKIERKYSPGDLKGYHLVYVGINDPDEERRILEEARSEGVLINFVDQVEDSDFISPSVILRNNFSLFVSTYGRGPGAVKLIRRTIEEGVDLDALDRQAGEFIASRAKKEAR